MATKKTEKVTSIEELKQYANGQLVRLPDFAEGMPFYARLRRPSMMQMVKDGKFPNTLLAKANSMFMNDRDGLDPEDSKLMADMFDVVELIASAAFVEPTYKQIKEAGIVLSDDQMMFLFNYTQSGTKALESFRTE